MTFILIYTFTLILMIFNILLFHFENRITIVGLIIISFIPFINCLFLLVEFVTRLICAFEGDYDILRYTKLTRWLFNSIDEDCFYKNKK